MQTKRPIHQPTTKSSPALPNLARMWIFGLICILLWSWWWRTQLFANATELFAIILFLFVSGWMIWGVRRGPGWFWPVAVVQHSLLGIGFLVLLFRADYANFAAKLPTLLVPTGWFWGIALALFLLSVWTFFTAYQLTLPTYRKRFLTKTPPRLTVCKVCGATLKSSDDPCDHCRPKQVTAYFLHPVTDFNKSVCTVPRLTLAFEPGHWTIRVGRDATFAGYDDLWINEKQYPAYKTVSRHHADIRLEQATGLLQIYSRSAAGRVEVNDKAVDTSAPLAVGDLIRLGNARFILGSPKERPQLAYLVQLPERKVSFLCRFRENYPSQQRIGRASDNDVSFPEEPRYESISRHHATLFYEPDGHLFLIRNDSSTAKIIYDNGEELAKDMVQEIRDNARIDLGTQKFIFIPITYSP
ncbi:MAG: FHA domain-containing protein [Chloroflexota bacterium]